MIVEVEEEDGVGYLRGWKQTGLLKFLCPVGVLAHPYINQCLSLNFYIVHNYFCGLIVSMGHISVPHFSFLISSLLVCLSIGIR